MAGHEELMVRAEAFVRAEMGDEPTGHDWWHAARSATPRSGSRTVR